MSRPVRALWIEMSADSFICPHLLSRPVRALWIEMLQVGFRQSEYFWEKSLMIWTNSEEESNIRFNRETSFWMVLESIAPLTKKWMKRWYLWMRCGKTNGKSTGIF